MFASFPGLSILWLSWALPHVGVPVLWPLWGLVGVPGTGCGALPANCLYLVGWRLWRGGICGAGQCLTRACLLLFAHTHTKCHEPGVSCSLTQRVDPAFCVSEVSINLFFTCIYTMSSNLAIHKSNPNFSFSLNKMTAANIPVFPGAIHKVYSAWHRSQSISTHLLMVIGLTV